MESLAESQIIKSPDKTGYKRNATFLELVVGARDGNPFFFYFQWVTVVLDTSLDYFLAHFFTKKRGFGVLGGLI